MSAEPGPARPAVALLSALIDLDDRQLWATLGRLAVDAPDALELALTRTLAGAGGRDQTG